MFTMEVGTLDLPGCVPERVDTQMEGTPGDTFDHLHQACLPFTYEV